MRGRTALILAPGLNTIEHADRVVVMEHGRIVEEERMPICCGRMACTRAYGTAAAMPGSSE